MLDLIATADDTTGFKQTVTRLVLADAQESALRGRTWFKFMNFDAHPGQLSDVPTMLEDQDFCRQPIHVENDPAMDRLTAR